LVLIKPDGVQRSLVGEVIKRYEQMGLKLVAIKMLVATQEQAEKHYTLDSGWKEAVGRRRIESYKQKGLKPLTDDPREMGGIVLEKLKKFINSGPVVAMVWQGAHAVEIVRKITGDTEPLTSDVGTIRGDFVIDSYQMADADNRAVRNIVHASGSAEGAKKEIAHWFKETEIINYKLVQEQILYDVDWDGLLE
jgi:nucleoside-diphosphate kinase